MEIERDWSKVQAIRPSVSAIVFHTGKILLQQRADNREWGLPGGSVEIGETVADAVVREVREETGYEVAVGRLVGVYSDPRLCGQDRLLWDQTCGATPPLWIVSVISGGSQVAPRLAD